MMNRNEKHALPKPRMQSLVADHTSVVWCDRCRRDRILVVTGRNFQMAWCLNCRGAFSLAVRESDRICVLDSVIHRWIRLGDSLLIHTAERLILIRLGQTRKLQRH